MVEVVLQTNFNIILIMYLVLPRFLVAHTYKVAVLLHNFVVAFLFEIFQINIVEIVFSCQDFWLHTQGGSAITQLLGHFLSRRGIIIR